MTRKIRTINFLIDNAAIFGCVVLLSVLLVNVVSQANLRIVGMVFYYIYYFALEAIFGQTLGKLITKSIVTDSQGEKRPSVMQIFIRTISRLIPIDFISYFFNANGIHDYLSKTQLVTKNSQNEKST